MTGEVGGLITWPGRRHAVVIKRVVKFHIPELLLLTVIHDPDIDVVWSNMSAQCQALFNGEGGFGFYGIRL